MMTVSASSLFPNLGVVISSYIMSFMYGDRTVKMRVGRSRGFR